jgi:hypothetical protein
MQGETVSIEFSSADATTAAAVTLKDSAGATRTLASNEVLLIDSLTAALAAAVLLAEVFGDVDADGAVDAGERLASFAGAGSAASNFIAGPEGLAVKQGFTPKVKATVAGNVQITGSGRIIKGGTVSGQTRASYQPRSGGGNVAGFGKIGGKALTGELRKLASEVHTSDAHGNAITKEQALSDLIWKQALGWEEVTRDEMGNLVKVLHKPVAWAQQYLFERLEGKAPIAMPDNDGGMKAADKVRQLAKDRINARAVASAGIGKPPKHKPKA